MITAYVPRKIEDHVEYEGNRYSTVPELKMLIELMEKKKSDLIGVHPEDLTALTWAEVSRCEGVIQDAKDVINKIIEEAVVKDDPVNHPSHYTSGKIEVLDAIIDWKLDFARGNVVKYVARAGKKDDELQDLEKAAFYLARAIKELKEKRLSEAS